MCKLLGVSRAMLYYKPKDKSFDTELENNVIEVFKSSRKCYGTRKIKRELLFKYSKTVSRRRISSIMKKYGLVSKYTLKCYKNHKSTVNNDDIGNVLDRAFNREETLDVLVSDLTYVRVGNKWNYICTIIDLFNREIVGYSVGTNKTAELVLQAFESIKRPLGKVNLFHSDRGSEFKNKAIDELFDKHNIRRSLSHKGCPYDNAVAESTYKIIKTEFVFDTTFDTLHQLELEFSDYVNWYNNIRIHGSLDYSTPNSVKLNQSFVS